MFGGWLQAVYILCNHLSGTGVQPKYCNLLQCFKGWSDHSITVLQLLEEGRENRYFPSLTKYKKEAVKENIKPKNFVEQNLLKDLIDIFYFDPYGL